MFRLTQERSGETGKGEVRILKIEGAATVEHAGQLRDGLLEVLGAADQVLLDCGKISEIDFYGLQLFCSAHRSALAGNRRLALTGTISPEVEKAARVAGFVRRHGCPFVPSGGSCLWECRDSCERGAE